MASARENYLRVGPYLEIFQGVRTALNINEGIIKVVGAKGTGKTAFCSHLVAELEAENQDVIYFDTPPQNAEELYQTIQGGLGLDRNKDFNRALTRYLLDTSSNHKLVIIYNDAEKISKELFILIRLLNNIHDESSTLVSQIITGTNQLDVLFDDPALRSLTQYLNQSFTLSPMSRVEVEDFYSSYIINQGISARGMSNKDLTDLYISSKGFPGKAVEILEKFFPPKSSSSKAELKPIPQEVPVKAALQENNNLKTEITSKEPGVENAEVETMQAAELEPENLSSDTDDSYLTDLEFIPPKPEPPPVLPETPVKEAYVKEVSQILDKDQEKPKNFSPSYFKFGLYTVVGITTLVLIIILSVNKDAANNKLEDILAIDAPLYLDEISTALDTDDPDSLAAASTQGTGQAAPQLAIVEREPEPASLTDTTDPSATAVIPAEETLLTGEAIVEDTAEEIVEEIAEEKVNDQSEPVETIALIDEAETYIEITTNEAVEAAIIQWVSAWGNGNFENYLAAYHESFNSPSHASRAQWISQRRSRIEGASDISIKYDRLDVIRNEGNEALVRFRLQYARDNYADETLKEMLFILEENNWLIKSEENIEVIRINN